MNLRTFVLTATAGSSLLAACGTSPTAPIRDTGATTVVHPNPTEVHGAPSGRGDTSTNPDTHHYVCGGRGLSDDRASTIMYLTVSGWDRQHAEAMCGAMAKGAGDKYEPLSTLPVHDAVAGCYLTTPDGGATARIYTGPDGNDTTTASLCDQMLQAAGQPPQPAI